MRKKPMTEKEGAEFAKRFSEAHLIESLNAWNQHFREALEEINALWEGLPETGEVEDTAYLMSRIARKALGKK